MNTNYHSRRFVRGMTKAAVLTLALALMVALLFLSLTSALGETNASLITFETWEQISARWKPMTPEQLRQAAEAGKAEAQYFLSMTEWLAAWDDAWRSRNLWNSMDRTNKTQAKLPALNNAALRTNWSGIPEQEIREAALAGDRGARWYIGKMESDRGAERARASVPWLKRSAAQQFLPAVHELAVRYLGQTGWRIVSTDTAEGLKLLRSAADKGYPPSQLRLGEMLIRGDLVPPDVPAAIRWLQQAADQGLPRAQFALAQQYAVGQGEPRSAGETPVALFRKAADAGVTEAQLALAERCRTGLGTTRDYFEAANWFCRAGEASVASQLPIAGATERAWSPLEVWVNTAKPNALNDPEFDQAFRTFVRAAKLRDVDAQMQIGDYYAQAKGAERSDVRAFFWYDQAAAQGISAAMVQRDALKGALTAEERQQLLRWKRESAPSSQ